MNLSLVAAGCSGPGGDGSVRRAVSLSAAHSTGRGWAAWVTRCGDSSRNSRTVGAPNSGTAQLRVNSLNFAKYPNLQLVSVNPNMDNPNSQTILFVLQKLDSCLCNANLSTLFEYQVIKKKITSYYFLWIERAVPVDLHAKLHSQQTHLQTIKKLSPRLRTAHTVLWQQFWSPCHQALDPHCTVVVALPRHVRASLHIDT